MRNRIIVVYLILNCVFPLFAQDKAWLDAVSHRVDEDAVTWLREHLKGQTVGSSSPISSDLLPSKECKNCLFSSPAPTNETNLMIFMSFSVPDEVWLLLSGELEKIDGQFILRGLPQNSFKHLSQRLLVLKQKGLNASVQIDPRLFQDYDIKTVPCFLVKGEKSYDKVQGNISLASALEILSSHSGDK